MTILVTGGAGFIGSNFVLDCLARSDEPVVNLDKLTYAGNLQRIGVGNGSRRPLPPNPVCGFPATGSPVGCFLIGIGAPIGGPLTS